MLLLGDTMQPELLLPGGDSQLSFFFLILLQRFITNDFLCSCLSSEKLGLTVAFSETFGEAVICISRILLEEAESGEEEPCFKGLGLICCCFCWKTLRGFFILCPSALAFSDQEYCILGETNPESCRFIVFDSEFICESS